tara:strand:+ start:33013 stop:33693 length:681 start_codon:yes stop_codon:yes gene_type:complete
MDIEWEGGSVCFANGVQHECGLNKIENLIIFDDFQLNTIKQGDYIEASELDTEQEYNDAVEVFGLFGNKDCISINSFNGCDFLLVDLYGDICGCSAGHFEAKRKLNYPQLMAIGKLKRAIIERDEKRLDDFNKLISGESIVKISLEGIDNKPDEVNKPSHYQFFEGVEVIEIIASSMTREQFKGYCLGNRIKYRLRAGNKDKLEQEIAKSDKYVGLYDEHKHLCKK